MHITQNQSNFNTPEPDRIVAKAGGASPRHEFLRLGAELYSRGQQPVAQFVSELAGLAPDLTHEIQLRLEAYTRIPAETYQALGADRFTPFMISIDGGRE